MKVISVVAHRRALSRRRKDFLFMPDSLPLSSAVHEDPFLNCDIPEVRLAYASVIVRDQIRLWRSENRPLEGLVLDLQAMHGYRRIGPIQTWGQLAQHLVNELLTPPGEPAHYFV